MPAPPSSAPPPPQAIQITHVPPKPGTFFLKIISKLCFCYLFINNNTLKCFLTLVIYFFFKIINLNSCGKQSSGTIQL